MMSGSKKKSIENFFTNLGTKRKWKHNTTKQWDTLKTVLWGKFIAVSVYNKNWKGAQMNDLMMQLKTLEKQDQT